MRLCDTIPVTTIPEIVLTRAALKYTKAEVSGCWISNYSTNSGGYAQIGWQSDGKVQVTPAARAAYRFWNPTVDITGIAVRTRCNDRRCVSPLHLTTD